MSHIHFGAGRLGLGLVAPVFRGGDSELYLLNRAVSGVKATGDTAVSSARRNALEVEFSRHVDTEKQIKSWLLNGTHWLIALNAFQESRGGRDMKLNEFLIADPRQLAFARTAMEEMKEGVAILLRGDDRFRGFVADTDVEAYLNGAASAILARFCATEDPITRILARFRAPTPGSMDTVASFSERFADRAREPMRAYEAARGVRPPAATRGVRSLDRLVASRTFITAAAA